VTTLAPDEIESIHREVDGLNTPDESAAVRSLVEKSPEARRQYEQLRVINSALARIDAQQDTAPGTQVPPGSTVVIHLGSSQASPSPSSSASPSP